MLENRNTVLWDVNQSFVRVFLMLLEFIGQLGANGPADHVELECSDC